MLKRMVLLIIILMLLSTQKLTSTPPEPIVSLALSDEAKKPLIMVIVHSSIYAAIKSSLNQYTVDVENAGFSVNITETNQLSDKTAKGIRAYLQNAHARNHDLAGAFLVGDIPEAWYEVGANRFPTDMYYKDLNGLWMDLNDDGIYDEHSGDITPEIWVGRLKASTISGDEVSLINNYFTKNHRYRNSLRTLPWWRALVYIDDHGVSWAEEAELSLSQVATDITLVTDPATTNARNYKSRLKDPFGYQWVYLMCHGSFDHHVFMAPEGGQGPSQWSDTVYSHNYLSIDPRVFFYLFFVCSAARYTESGYLAGSSIFTDSYGLLAIGSSDAMVSISLSKFFTSLSEGKSIGIAFQEWFIEKYEKHDQLSEKQDPQIMFYGLTMVGDPTLQPCRRPSVLLHDISITDVTTHLRDVKGEGSMSVTVAIENRGNFTETFDLTIYYHLYTLVSVSLSLAAKANTTMTFTIAKPYRVSFGNYRRRMMEVTAGIVPEEFNEGDNVKRVPVEGVLIERMVFRYSPYILIFPFVIFAMISYGFLKALMSERPPLLRYWTSMRGYFAKKLFDLKHKLGT